MCRVKFNSAITSVKHCLTDYFTSNFPKLFPLINKLFREQYKTLCLRLLFETVWSWVKRHMWSCDFVNRNIWWRPHVLENMSVLQNHQDEDSADTSLKYGAIVEIYLSSKTRQKEEKISEFLLLEDSSSVVRAFWTNGPTCNKILQHIQRWKTPFSFKLLTVTRFLESQNTWQKMLCSYCKPALVMIFFENTCSCKQVEDRNCTLLSSYFR